MNLKNLIIIVFFNITLIVSTSNAADNYMKINYGISNNNTGITAAVESKGSMTSDEEDTGLMLSAGSMIGDFWGVDLAYYNLGSSSVKVDAGSMITSNKISYVAESAGTIKNDISGFGLGLILGNNNDLAESFALDYYVKVGAHSWDKSGSTTILDNNDGFKSSFYNEGIGAYGGLGVSMGLFNGIVLDIAYDVIGISNNVSFDNNSSLLSGGLKFKF